MQITTLQGKAYALIENDYDMEHIQARVKKIAQIHAYNKPRKYRKRKQAFVRVSDNFKNSLQALEIGESVTYTKGGEGVPTNISAYIYYLTHKSKERAEYGKYECHKARGGTEVKRIA